MKIQVLLQKILDGDTDDIEIKAGNTLIPVSDDCVVIETDRGKEKAFLKVPNEYKIASFLVKGLGTGAISTKMRVLDFLIQHTYGRPRIQTEPINNFNADKVEFVSIPPAVCPNCGYHHQADDPDIVPEELKEYLDDNTGEEQG